MGMHGNRSALKRLLYMVAILLPSLVMGQETFNSIPGNLRGAAFRLTSATVGDRQFPIPAQPAITISFEENGRVSGHSAVNFYFGSLSVGSDGTITWGSEGWALTRRSGLPALMDLETLYLQVLERTTTLSTDGSTLTFSSDDPAISLLFERLAAAPQAVADFLGKPLTLTSLVLDGNNYPLPAKQRPSMTINPNGACAGFSGVNRFFGRFVIAENGGVDAGPFGSTMMAGPAGLMDFETAFLKALNSVKRVEAAGKTLRLLDSAGSTVLAFETR
jgi:heat shock protein HslJ